MKSKNVKKIRRITKALSVTAVLALALTTGLTLSGCGNTEAKSSSSSSKASKKSDIITLNAIASTTPHQDLLEKINPDLEKQGYTIKIVGDGSDGAYNEKTANGEVDFNYVQHQPYLDSQIEANGWDNLVNVGDIHIEPITAYSDKYKSTSEIQKGDTVAIPNDGTNEYRALKILADNGLIKLDEKADSELSASADDITDNTYNLKIVELDSAQIIPTKDDYDFFVVNTNKALEADLQSNKLFAEGKDSKYANIIATSKDTLKDDKKAKGIRLVVEELQSPEIQNYITEHYNGAVIPAATDGSSSPESSSDDYFN